MSANETPKHMSALLCCLYKRAVLWSLSGYGKYLTAKIVMVGSFAVCTSVQTAVLTSAHKNGVGSGPNYSMFVKMMVQEILRPKTIFIDLYPGTHHCTALDERVPSDLARQGAACASDIVKLGLTVITFGGHAKAVLCKAVKQTNRKVKTIHAPHPCNLSASKSSNDVAIGYAKQYDVLFPSEVGTFEGLVYGYGLNPDSRDNGVGGVLGVNFSKRHLEKVSGVPCENVHISASSFCLGLGVENDEQAAAYLTSIGCGHHLVPSRTLLYIILHAIKGGSCGGLNDYQAVKAHTMLDTLRNASKIDDDATKAAMKALEHAKELRDIMSKGKSIYQKELIALGVHPWQVHARAQLVEMGIPIPDDANVLSLYQEVLMKRGTHNFQVHAANMLTLICVTVPVGGNVLSIYQKELIALGVHPWQVYAWAQLLKMGIPIPDDANVLRQKEKMVNGVHPFQVHADYVDNDVCDGTRRRQRTQYL